MSEAMLLQLATRDLANGRPYAERDERAPPWYDAFALAMWHGWVRPTWRAVGGRSRTAERVVAMTRRCEAEMRSLSDEALRAQALASRRQLRREGFVPKPTARLFAIVREAAGRVLGKRHYDCQIHAGWLLLQGALVEMATGEGKTFAATLPACAAALVGLPVHVVTVNDYLAARDAQTMGPLYGFFGLRCAAIVHELTREQRRSVYAGDVAYCSNKELTFDYLRDRTALGDRASALHAAVAATSGRGARGPQTVLRGLAYAIVDEADSVFIDEARTPLILSATTDGAGQQRVVGWALESAAAMDAHTDFQVERAAMRVRLTDAGRDRIEERFDAAVTDAEQTSALPLAVTLREASEAVTQALAALWLYHRDQHYLIADGKAQIIDESTGRVMADRAWERRLHQMIEAKEGLSLSGERVTLARITYQRFFRRYLRLAGMTGTVTEVAAEIGRVYRLPVWRVPLNRPSMARQWPSRCMPDQGAKLDAVVDSVRRHACEQGRPVLVGTRTVHASEALSSKLTAAGIDHVVLNAKQDRAEAEIVARAGAAAAVTVATNMAGRGTDIELGEGVAQRGGLHVIVTEFHESARVDRQLLGRAARQGDPGSGEAIVAIDDELFGVHAPGPMRFLSRAVTGRGRLARAMLAVLRHCAQTMAEWRNRSLRADSLGYDRRLAALLSFSGRGE